VRTGPSQVRPYERNSAYSAMGFILLDHRSDSRKTTTSLGLDVRSGGGSGTFTALLRPGHVLPGRRDWRPTPRHTFSLRC
jgi:hypothetical protein